jgi:SAM-dependent methyltransferase
LRTETARALRAVNRRFYHERAAEFSLSRERPWSGWSQILDRARSFLPDRPRVLDVGCGNGRFARFLEDRLGTAFDYCGVDESPLSLADAKRRLPHREFLDGDFLEALPEGRFDLVALFGVLHHVPGRENRTALLTDLSARLSTSGILTFSLWRFDRSPRLRKKIVPWEEFRARTGLEVDLPDLESGDHILTWGGDPPAYRYCHAMSDEEEAEIEAALPLDLVLKFDAGAEPNRYFAFRTQPFTSRSLPEIPDPGS